MIQNIKTWLELALSEFKICRRPPLPSEVVKKIAYVSDDLKKIINKEIFVGFFFQSFGYKKKVIFPNDEQCSETDFLVHEFFLVGVTFSDMVNFVFNSA